LAKAKELMEEHARLMTRLKHAQIPYTTELESALTLGEPKRCELSIVFCSIVGLDELLKLEPRVVAETLGPIISILHHHIYSSGGMVDKPTSRGLMAIFGLGTDSGPTSAAASLDNMVRSFPAVCNSIARHRKRPEALNLKLAIGATLGQVLLGTVGSKNRMELAVVGPGANLAARLTELAERSLTTQQGIVDPRQTSALAITTPNILANSYVARETVTLREDAFVRSFPDMREVSVISI
jgi:class 3 adenylate cyclase